MAKIAYVTKKFRKDSIEIIAYATLICEEFQAQGFDLTLRQLYYQFVSRDLLPNNDRSYKRLGSIINDARLAGLLDWDFIIDRTRNVRSVSHWDDPGDVIEAAARSYHNDLWSPQDRRVEVWIEKDALVGVIEPVCTRNDVPFFSCRGYTSQSEMHAAALRHRRYEADGQEVTVLHLGDHDPSGIDMSRDIQERLWTFGANTHVDRIALTMDQVNEFDPPPNPAKLTDARAEGYIDIYGPSSWELDALSPTTIDELIQERIESLRDADAWDLAYR